MTFRLTLRRAALLHAIRYGNLPWWEETERSRDRHGASKGEGQREWIMCCGHVYRDAEVAEMVRLGWIGIEPRRNRWGEPYLLTVAGPKIADAWQWPHYA